MQSICPRHKTRRCSEWFSAYHQIFSVQKTALRSLEKPVMSSKLDAHFPNFIKVDQIPSAEDLNERFDMISVETSIEVKAS